MSLKLVTAPTVEPISLVEAKLHLRVDGSDEDSLISDLIIPAARLDVETLSLHKLITQTWDWYMDDWPESVFKVPYPPLQSVTGIYYTLDGAAEATFSAANYTVDVKSVPGWIALNSNASWPSGTLAIMNGVRIRFVCGFGAAGSAVDARLRQAMLLLIGHYYEHREAVIVERGMNVVEMPVAVGSLCNDLRMKVKTF